MWFIHQPKAIITRMVGPMTQCKARDTLPQLDAVFLIMKESCLPCDLFCFRDASNLLRRFGAAQEWNHSKPTRTHPRLGCAAWRSSTCEPTAATTCIMDRASCH